MNTPPVASRGRILVVAATPAEHEALHHALAEGGPLLGSFEPQGAGDLQEGLALMQDALQARQPYAVAFIAISSARGRQELAAVPRLWALDPAMQVVLCVERSHAVSSLPLASLGATNGSRWVILRTPADPVEVTQLAHALAEKSYGLRLATGHPGVPGSEDGLEAQHPTQALRVNEHDLLRALLDNAPDHIYFKDARSRYILCSKAQAQQLGAASAAELVGRTDFDFFTGAYAQAAYEDEQQILRTGQPVVGKAEKAIWKDGRGEAWLLSARMPLHNSAGAVIGTFGISKDITALKQTEAALAYHHDLLTTLMENSPDSIYFKDLESRLVKVSRSEVHNLLRLSLSRHRATHPGTDEAALPPHLASVEAFEQYVIGKTDADIYGQDRASEFSSDEQEILRTGLPIVEKSERTVHPDGRVVWYLTTKGPWRDRNGRLIGTFGTSKNMSQLKEAERRIEEVQSQLLTAARLAGMAEIATNVLHNVGNVLNSVNVSAELIGTRLRASKLKGLARCVDLMEAHAADLGEFLSHDSRGRLLPTYLRELARTLEEEHQAIAAELGALCSSVDHIKQVIATQQSYAGSPRMVESARVDELLDDALRINAGALTRHKVEVVKNYAALPPLLLDRHRVLQVLVNLISNAKQAMDALEDRRPVIHLDAALADGPVLRIAVTDNGEGIAPENLSRVFSHGFTTRKDGHGFGLHSCVLAAQEMGGSLRAHSAGPGQGATFTLEVPVALAQAH